MKYFLISFITIMFSNLAGQNYTMSANGESYTAVASTDHDNSAEYAYHTSRRDTLFLMNGDELSKITHNIWISDKTYKGSNPKIVFVSSEQMVRLKQRSRTNTNSNLKTTKN